MASPLSAMGKYQLVVLGPNGDPQVRDCAGRLDKALNISFTQLGVNFGKFLVSVISGASSPDIDRRMPSVAVFFGLGSAPVLSPLDTHRMSHLLTDGVLIIPAVSDTKRFSTLVPPQIADLNGVSLEDCGAEFERLAARILEGFGLLRERRRLFISYRRVETSGVAGQLYEALDAAGFDVFLDTHGTLRPGEPFPRDSLAPLGRHGRGVAARLSWIFSQSVDRGRAGASQHVEHPNSSGPVAWTSGRGCGSG